MPRDLRLPWGYRYRYERSWREADGDMKGMRTSEGDAKGFEDESVWVWVRMTAWKRR